MPWTHIKQCLGYVRNPRSLMEALCRDDIWDLFGSPVISDLRENANEIGQWILHTWATPRAYGYKRATGASTD